MLTLIEWARRYTDARPLSDHYAETLRKRAAALQAFSKRPYLQEVLTEDTINRFLKLREGSPYTVAKYRQDFLALWRAAADEDLVPYPIARRLWRPRTPALVVNCYTLDEVRAILVAAESLPGAFPNAIPRRRYWPAMIRLAWDSGLRRGDLWRLKSDCLRPDGSFAITQNKTGQVVVCRLRPNTVDLLRMIGEMRWPLCGRQFAMQYKEIIRLANVNRGSFKWLRRSSGSYVEREQPGAGHKHLGNGAGVFARHYDARLGGVSRPMPPEL